MTQAHFEPCNDACAAGASCPSGGVCDLKHKASEPPFVYIPRWSDDLRNVVLASVLAAVVGTACFVAIAFETGVIR